MRAEPPRTGPEVNRLLAAIDELASELDRRGELEHVPQPLPGNPGFTSASLDHPELLPLLNELGVALGVGACPREA
jgi:hypothetical protein